jgi:ATP/maltotriose-dependent transcriptional regulator MalT
LSAFSCRPGCELLRQNLFIVSLDQQRRWYRYHHLFGEFLHTQLVETASPDVITDLHDRASAWFEANGFIQDAIQHALAAEDVDGSFNTNLALRGVITFDLALGHEYGGETSAAIQAFEEAIDLTRADGNIRLLPLCISHLAQLQVLCGDLHAAMQVYERGLRIAEGEAPSPLSGMAYTGAAQVLYEWNELEEAASYLAQGLALGHPWSQWEILWAGYTGLADIDWVQGHPERARARLQTLTEQVQRLGMQWAIPAVEAHRVVLAVRLGDRAGSSQC